MIIVLLIILLLVIILGNYKSYKYPTDLNQYIIYGKIDKKDKKTYHYQFIDNKFYKLDKYGNLIKKGTFEYKTNNNIIDLYIDSKKYKLTIQSKQNKNIFNCSNQYGKLLLIKIIKRKHIKSLDGKIINFTTTITDSKNNNKKNQNYTIFYGKNTYTKYNPFVNTNKDYLYYVNEYGNSYIILENSIIKMIYKSHNNGTFIINSGKKIIEGFFKILN